MPQVTKSHSSKEFTKDRFVMLIMMSDLIKQMPQRKRDKMVWFMLRAEEKIQIQFYDMLVEAKAVSEKYDDKMRAAKYELWSEYMNHVNMEEKLIINKMRKNREDFDRSKELNASEQLLKNL